MPLQLLPMMNDVQLYFVSLNHSLKREKESDCQGQVACQPPGGGEGRRLSFSDSMEADRHLKIYHPNNTTWNDRGQFSQQKSGYYSEGKIYACLQPKEKKKEKESYQQQHVCVFVYHLRKTSRSYDIIKKTISGHKRSHQPESTISDPLSLPQIPHLLCSKKVILTWLVYLYSKQECPSTWLLDQIPQVQWVIVLTSLLI